MESKPSAAKICSTGGWMPQSINLMAINCGYTLRWFELLVKPSQKTRLRSRYLKCFYFQIDLMMFIWVFYGKCNEFQCHIDLYSSAAILMQW